MVRHRDDEHIPWVAGYQAVDQTKCLNLSTPVSHPVGLRHMCLRRRSAKGLLFHRRPLLSTVRERRATQIGSAAGQGSATFVGASGCCSALLAPLAAARRRWLQTLSSQVVGGRRRPPIGMEPQVERRVVPPGGAPFVLQTLEGVSAPWIILRRWNTFTAGSFSFRRRPHPMLPAPLGKCRRFFQRCAAGCRRRWLPCRRRWLPCSRRRLPLASPGCHRDGTSRAALHLLCKAKMPSPTAKIAMYSNVVTIHYKDLRQCKEQPIKYKTVRLNRTKINASMHIVNHANKQANKSAHIICTVT